MEEIKKRIEDLESVVEPEVINPEAMIEEGGDKLENLRTFAKKNVKYIFHNTIHIISDLNVLIFAYETIKSESTNTTKGISKKNLEGISPNWFIKISKKLLAGQFKFNPSKRTDTFKSNDLNAKKPLGITSLTEKVVQKSIQMVLECIFESTFLDESHGFRPGRGNHTALKYVKMKFKAANWAIEANTSNCFNTIDHRKLLNIIRERISCDKTIALIKSALEAGIIKEANFKENRKAQGNVISPLLCNIFMHKLDKFLTAKAQEFEEGGSKRPRNNDKRNLKYKLNQTTDQKEKKAIFKELLITKSNLNTDSYKKLMFVRYVDNFLVAIAGKYQDCVKLKQEIYTFLREKSLKLNPLKMKITKMSSNKVFFLGTFIRGTYRKIKPIQIIVKNKKRIKTQITPQVSFHAPIAKILQKLIDKKFMRRKNSLKIQPTGVKVLVNFDHADILLRFNQIIRAILNYYSFVDNHKSLGTIVHGLKMSCALTLSLKFKMITAAKAFKTFGKTLKCKESKTELYIPKTFKRTQKFVISKPLPYDIINLSWNGKLTRSNMLKSCIICGESENIEMHHVKQKKDLKFKYKSGKINFFTLQTRAINRNQVPLCKDHHIRFHNNTLIEEDKQKMRDYIQSCKRKK